MASCGRRLPTVLMAMGAVIAALTASPQATTIIAPRFDELVSQAEVVFESEVIDTRSRLVAERDGTTIVTEVVFRVARVLKGRVGPTTILEFVGGTIGDLTYQIDGMPTFARGDRDVLFATPSLRQVSPLVAMMYGRVRIERDPATNQPLVRKFDRSPLREASALTFRAAAPLLSPIPSMSLAVFEDAVIAEVARQNGGAR